MADDVAPLPDETAPLLALPFAAEAEQPAEAALVARSPGTVAALARSRYEAPALHAVLPRPLPLLAAPPGSAGGAGGSAPGSPDGGRAQAPRGRSRLESLLDIILQEQREQAERITRLQEGIDDLNSRLRSPERVPTLPVQVQLAPAAAEAPPATPPEAQQHAPAAARSPSLVEIATEVALLNALSEVLVRHHEAAQERAAAAATRLQRAEAHAAAVGAADAAPPQLGAPEEVLALEYSPMTGDANEEASQQLVVQAASSPPAASSAVLDGATAMLRRYRDARAEARGAAARDAAITQRSRELLALTERGEEDEPPRPPSPGSAPPLRPLSPRDHTPASGGALVVHSGAGRGLDVAAAAARAASGDALRNLLDFALSDADFGRVLSLLAAAGGHAGPAPASPDAIRAVPDLPGGADAAELDARECPVCLAELAGGGAVKAMPCGSSRVPHAFHAACIERWLGMHNSCPTCRTALAEPPARAGATTPDAAL